MCTSVIDVVDEDNGVGGGAGGVGELSRIDDFDVANIPYPFQDGFFVGPYQSRIFERGNLPRSGGATAESEETERFVVPKMIPWVTSWWWWIRWIRMC